jgi:hypothetical protein
MFAQSVCPVLLNIYNNMEFVYSIFLSRESGSNGKRKGGVREEAKKRERHREILNLFQFRFLSLFMMVVRELIAYLPYSGGNELI